MKAHLARMAAMGLALALLMVACGDDSDDATETATPADDTATPADSNGGDGATPSPTEEDEAEPTSAPLPPDEAPGGLAWGVELGGDRTTFVATDGETVVVSATDGESSGQLVAYDAADGDEQWRQRIDAATLVPGIGDGVAAVADANGIVHAYDAESGDEQWTYDTGGAPAQVVIREGLVFAAEANPAWFGSEEISTAAEAQGNIYAITTEDGEDEWVRLGNAPSYSGIVFEGGVLYAVTEPVEDGDVRVAAISAPDGEQGWSESLGPGMSGLPAFDELHVYVAAEWVVALERATGEIAWEFEAPEGVLHAPVVVDDFVATGSDADTWFLVDRTEGDDATEVSYCDCPWLGASGDGTLYLAAPELAAYDMTDFDAESPEPEWIYPVSEGGFTLPVVSQDHVVAGTTSAGIVVAFER